MEYQHSPKAKALFIAYYQSILPTRYNLGRRIAIPSTRCLVCMIKEEADEHILLNCAFVQMVWHGMKWGMMLSFL